MGSCVELVRQVAARVMHHLMAAPLPQKAARHVVHPALVGDVGRDSIPSRVPRELIDGECFHLE